MSLDSTQLRSIDDDARRRFEAAWRDGRPQSWNDFLPPPTDARREATLEEIACIDLELSWKEVYASAATNTLPANGNWRPPLVEEYLTRYPELHEPAVLLRLVQQEYLVRHRCGDCPAPEQYAARFPALFPPPGDTTVQRHILKHERVAGERNRAQPTDPRPEIADYELRELVGRGGMGVVYEAHEAELGRVVALKTIRANQVSPEERERFLNEARIAAKLEHPGVVPVHELVRPERGEPYYTMQLVRGKTLEIAIKEFHATQLAPGPREVARRRLLSSCLTVVRTMAFAHSKGVIHRDLKPANIVLGKYGETVILDWGLAKVLGEKGSMSASRVVLSAAAQSAETVAGTILGTPAYMSPEQAAGMTAAIDERSDVYALGAILYQILANKPPPGHYSATHGGKDREKPPQPPPPPRSIDRTIPRPLQAICLRAIETDRDIRYQSASELADDLEKFLAGEPVTVYREGLTERFARFARRHRTWVATAVVAFILATIGVTLGVIQLERNRLQRESLEAQHKQEQKQRQREEQLRLASAARQDDALGLAQLHAGRFESAARIFQAAVDRVANQPELADLYHQLEQRRQRARKVAQFYTLWEIAERFAVETPNVIDLTVGDLDTMGACSAGLDQLGIFDDKNVGQGSENKPQSWWQKLPADDLLPAQRQQLESDVASALGLLALWKVKEFYVKGNPENIKAALGWPRQRLQMVRDYLRSQGRPPSVAVEALDIYCAAKLEEPLPDDVKIEVRSGPDAYYLGVTHVLLDDLKSLSQLTGNSSIAGKLVAETLPAAFRNKVHLDFEEPAPRGEQLLRQAVTLDPSHYWSHFWLARSLRKSKDLAGVEEATNACIGLRPHVAIAYIERAFNQLDRVAQGERELATAREKKEADADIERRKERLLELKRQVLQGLEPIQIAQPHDPRIHWVRGLTLAWNGRHAETIEEISTAAALEAAQLIAEGGRGAEHYAIAPEMRRYLRPWKMPPDKTADLQATKALLDLCHFHEKLTTLEQPQRMADDSLAAKSRQPHALAVRGAVALEEKKWPEAIAAFEAALQELPDQPLASLGLAIAWEKAENWRAALDQYELLLKRDAVRGHSGDWWELVIHLGRGRSQHALGNMAAAREAWEDARAINPQAANKLRELLKVTD